MDWFPYILDIEIPTKKSDDDFQQLGIRRNPKRLTWFEG